MPDNIEDTVEVHERLARMEALMEAIKEALEDQKECDEKLDGKIDKILENDKDKLARISVVEDRVKTHRKIIGAIGTILAGAAITLLITLL